MTTHVYMMRHGETLFNLQKKNQGWCDSPLTLLGKKQAWIAHQYFEQHHITFDVAYTSTQERAIDTLEIVTNRQMPYTRLKGLKEWNFGALEAKDSFLNPPFPYGDGFVQYGGESETDFRHRVLQTVDQIIDENPDKAILIVAHGAVLGQFAKANLEHAIAKYKPGITNCAIFHYTVENGLYICQEIIEHDFTHIQDLDLPTQFQ